MNFDEMTNSLLESCREAAPFAPMALYDPDGDCVEFFFVNEPFVAERLDRWVTVYRGRESGQVVGSFIKDLRRLVKAYPRLKILIRDGRVRLAHLFEGPQTAVDSDVHEKVYGEIIQMAKDMELQGDLASAIR